MFRRNTKTLASFVTQLFDGRIDYTDLFPYPTSDRSAEPGAMAVDALLNNNNKQQTTTTTTTKTNNVELFKALLASQVPPLAPEENSDNNNNKSIQEKDFGTNATNTSQDTVAWLAQHAFLRNANNNNSAVASELATHLSVGSYLLRGLAPEFSSEVQGVAAGNTISVVLTDEKVSGSFVAANSTSASYDDDKMMYLLQGEKSVATWNNNNNNGVTNRKILLVLARAETQVANAKGEQEIVKRLAWFPVDLSNAEQKATVSIVTTNNGGAIVRFNKTPVQGGNVLGAIGDGFRFAGVATLSTPHVTAASICGIAQKSITELLSSSSSSSSSSLKGQLALLQSEIYALESAAFAFATNIDRQISDTIIESACLSVAAYRLAEKVRSILLLNTSSNTNNNKDDAQALHDLMTSLGHPDQMSLFAGCCGVEDYGLKLNKRPTVEMSTLRTQRAMGMIDHYPSLVACEEPAKQLEKQIVAFAKIVHSAFVNNGPAVLYREALLRELGEVASVMYTSSCTLARINRCSASKQATADDEKKVATLYLTRAVAELDTLVEKVQRETMAPSRLPERLARFYVNQYSSAPIGVAADAEKKATIKK